MRLTTHPLHSHTCRETDWLFSSDGGRKQLAESAGFERLVVVALHRGHTYTGVEGVREEVGGRAVELVQGGVSQGKQVRRGGSEGEEERNRKEGKRGEEGGRGEVSHI